MGQNVLTLRRTQSMVPGYAPPAFTAKEAAIERALADIQKAGFGTDAVEHAVRAWVQSLQLGDELTEQQFLDCCMSIVTQGLSMRTSPVFIVLKLKETYGQKRPAR